MGTLVTESATVQNPLVRYAGEIGWEIAPKSEAVNLRKEGGRLNLPPFRYSEWCSTTKTYPSGYKILT
jgi:hypothetical protein